MDIGTAIGVGFGVVSGTIGTTLGVINFLQDRPRITVTFGYGMVASRGDPNAKYGFVTITNVGRRPVYLSHVHLVGPEGVIILKESVPGVRIGEGDKPKSYTLTHEELLQTYSDFARVRAVVQASTGVLYSSWLPSENIGWARTIRHWWNCRRRRLYLPASQTEE